MWELKNSDLVLNRIGEVNPLYLNDAIARFVGFVKLVKSGKRHPCRMRSPYIQNMKFVDDEGDRFVLLLPDEWRIAYRIAPGCSASSGDVVFVDIERFDDSILKPET